MLFPAQFHVVIKGGFRGVPICCPFSMPAKTEKVSQLVQTLCASGRPDSRLFLCLSAAAAATANLHALAASNDKLPHTTPQTTWLSWQPRLWSSRSTSRGRVPPPAAGPRPAFTAAPAARTSRTRRASQNTTRGEASRAACSCVAVHAALKRRRPPLLLLPHLLHAVACCRCRWKRGKRAVICCCSLYPGCRGSMHGGATDLFCCCCRSCRCRCCCCCHSGPAPHSDFHRYNLKRKVRCWPHHPAQPCSAAPHAAPPMFACTVHILPTLAACPLALPLHTSTGSGPAPCDQRLV